MRSIKEYFGSKFRKGKPNFQPSGTTRLLSVTYGGDITGYPTSDYSSEQVNRNPHSGEVRIIRVDYYHIGDGFWVKRRYSVR